MPLPLIALATSCRLARCWLYTKEPEAPVDSDRRLDRQVLQDRALSTMAHSGFHEDCEEDLRAQILRIEAYIEEHAAVVERCRKISRFKIRRS